MIDRSSIGSALLRPASDLLTESGNSAIVLDLTSLSVLPPAQLDQLAQWARQQSCPVVGLGNAGVFASKSVDTVVHSEAELQKLLDRINAFPQAATVLVQVLRSIENLPVEAALVVESLGYSALQSGDEFKCWLAQYRGQTHERLIRSPLAHSGPPVLSERQGGHLSITLNRPDNDNAYTVELRDALMDVFNLVALDSSITEVNVSANGRCFSTGGALEEFGQVSSPLQGHLIRSQVSPARLVLGAADRYRFHVHKACVGSGLELPACAGYLSASPKTTFWLPELSMGLIPGAGGCVSISRRIGRQRTAYMVLMNKKIDARKALEWGLIDAIIGD